MLLHPLPHAYVAFTCIFNSTWIALWPSPCVLTMFGHRILWATTSVHSPDNPFEPKQRWLIYLRCHITVFPIPQYSYVRTDELVLVYEIVCIGLRYVCLVISCYQVDFAMQSVYSALTAQQKQFARQAEQIQKITEISTISSRIQLTLDQIIPLLDRLNSILPVEEQLEPLSIKWIQRLKHIYIYTFEWKYACELAF